jgi:hypothetical protein
MEEFLIRINQDPCGLGFQGRVMPALKEWSFTPYPSSAAQMTHLENTAQGVNRNFLLAVGKNLINENGEINGTLQLKFQCLDMLKDRSFNRLTAIQIEGYPLGLGVGKESGLPPQFVTNLNSKSTFYNIPVGKKIKIQLMGGFGNVRYANTSDSRIVKINKSVQFEEFNYQPQLKNLNNTSYQINKGSFIVDRGLGEGNHIFTIEALSVGEAAIIFRDMVGSRHYLHISANANLCQDEIAIVDEDDNIYTNNLNNRGNYNVEPILNDLDFEKSIGNYCNCSTAAGDNSNGSMNISVPSPQSEIMSINHVGKIYDNEKFIRGTRSLDFENLEKLDEKNIPIAPAKIFDLYVGETVRVRLPRRAKTQYNVTVLNKENLDGKAVGAGWGEYNTGPAWSALKEDSQIVDYDINSGRITCKGPTNFLPAILHFQPRANNYNSVIGAIPAQEKEIFTSNDPADAILSFERHDGSKSYLKTRTLNGGIDTITMTNSDFFIGIRCFCEDKDFFIDESTVSEGDTFEVYAGGELLPKAQKYFFDKDSINNQGRAGKSNIIQNPNQDLTDPIKNGRKQFRIATIDKEKIVAFQEISMFLVDAPEGAKGNNIHKPAFRRFDNEFFIEGDFWNNLNIKDREGFNHSIKTGDEIFPCWKEQGNTIQPRGTWCIDKKSFTFYSKSEIPVVLNEKDEPKMINDLASRSFVVLDESQKHKKYSPEN